MSEFKEETSYIRIINLSYEYKKDGQTTDVFSHYSKDFPTGHLSVIMEPSGYGKTTLLYLIAGLLEPDFGDISYPLSRPRFSFVFQDDRLIEHLSVYDNIKFTAPDITPDEIKVQLNMLNMSNYEAKKVKNLSGGERKRVALLRALMSPYDILLLDEPFTGLDDETKQIVMDYTKKRTVGKTVLLVTHDKYEAEYMINKDNKYL